MDSRTIIFFVLFAVFYTVSCEEYDSSSFPGEESQYQPDLISAATGHHGGGGGGGGHGGRVQIKVYRGPSEGHDHKKFAPHGYWVKQPADAHHHH